MVVAVSYTHLDVYKRQSLYSPLLGEESDLRALGPMLASAARDHDDAHVMRFAPMDTESAAYKALLKELRGIGWIPFEFFCFGNWFLKVNQPVSYTHLDVYKRQG